MRRLGQWLLCALYVPVALVGVLVTPPAVMATVAPAVSLVATGVLAGLIRTCRGRFPDRRTSTVTATAGAGLVPFAEGVELLQELGTAIAVAVLVLLAVLGQRWWADNLEVCVADGTVRPPSLGSLRELLQTMPLETLVAEWRALEPGVEIPVDARHTWAAVHVRGLVLDELERRDRVGFHRWLDGGAVDAPSHLRDDQGPGRSW